MTYAFHTSMNDADASVSPGDTHQTVGKSPKCVQTLGRVQNIEKDANFSLGSMWAAFKHQSSRDVANPSESLTKPQIACHGSYSSSAISFSESKLCIAASSGAVQVLDYYPFGSERISSGQNSTDRHFIGERYDSSTELSYLNSRYYRGSQGQFISQDPVHLAIGNPNSIQSLTGASQQQGLFDPQLLNSYAYGRGNPLRYSDPDGNIAPAAVPFILFGIGGLLDSAANYYVDVMENRAAGNPNPYTTNLSSPAEYGVGFAGGGISMSSLGIGRVGGGVAAGVTSIVQDSVGGRSVDYGKAAITAGGTIVVGTAFKGLVGASQFEKAATRGLSGLSQNAITQGVRYQTSQGVLQSGVNAIAVSNYQIRNTQSQNFSQSSGGGGALSGVLSALSSALSKLSSLLKK